jgi:PBP1b-binding outer membrane lipoprotein LpoB
MTMMTRIWMLIIVALLVAACGGDSAGAGDPSAVVEQYLQASIESDAETLAAVMCAAMEADVEATALRFATVSGAEIQDMACTFDEAASTVTCDGQIVATYGTEDTVFPLGSYAVVQEGGEWKWCGEA